MPPLCTVPDGSFLMGSDPIKDHAAHRNEQPEHSVTLGAFQIGKYPVTTAEYACFWRAEQDPHYHFRGQPTRLDHPIKAMTWPRAMAYVTWLTVLTGTSWRLPTEAEWEKAARGTDARPVPWGDQFEASRCNTGESKREDTTPVGSFPTGASPCGAQDMAGNVWEWTNSLFIPYPYSPSDGREQAAVPNRHAPRVLRGGSYKDFALGVRTTRRNFYSPLGFDVTYGFRIVVAAALYGDK